MQQDTPQPSKQEFARLFHAELHEATRQAEEALGGSAARRYKIAFGEPDRRPLVDVDTAVERLSAQAPLFPRIIDVAVIGLEDEDTVIFVRPSDQRPSTWDQTWSVPPGRGPFKILISDRIVDGRKSKGSGPSDFIEVVPAQSFASADRRFDEWLAQRGMHRQNLADDDVRIDIVRQAHGGMSAKRYRVRRALIERS